MSFDLLIITLVTVHGASEMHQLNIVIVQNICFLIAECVVQTGAKHVERLKPAGNWSVAQRSGEPKLGAKTICSSAPSTLTF